MFGDMFAQMKEQQEKMHLALAQSEITGQAEGVSITINGLRELKAVKIDPALLQDGDAEQIEDLFLVAFNKAIAEVQQLEASQMSSLMSGGLGDLGALFGQ